MIAHRSRTVLIGFFLAFACSTAFGQIVSFGERVNGTSYSRGWWDDPHDYKTFSHDYLRTKSGNVSTSDNDISGGHSFTASAGLDFNYQHVSSAIRADVQFNATAQASTSGFGSFAGPNGANTGISHIIEFEISQHMLLTLKIDRLETSTGDADIDLAKTGTSSSVFSFGVDSGSAGAEVTGSPHEFVLAPGRYIFTSGLSSQSVSVGQPNTTYQFSSAGGLGFSLALAAVPVDLVLKNVVIVPSNMENPPSISGNISGGSPNGQAQIQASVDLGGSDPWTTLAAIRLDSSGNGSFTNLQDSRPVAANARSYFFRTIENP